MSLCANDRSQMADNRQSTYVLACPLLIGFTVNAGYHLALTGMAPLDIELLFRAVFVGCLASLPYGFVSLALYFACRWPLARRLCLAAAGMMSLVVLHGWWMHVVVSQSSSSTAAFAMNFLPVFGTLVVGPALFLGWLISLLPFVPREDRAMRLARGACPECGYDLRGRFDVGCPECGYQRPA